MQEISENSIHCILNKFGVPSNRKGYRMIADAVQMIAADPLLAQGVTRHLYPEVAEHFNTKWQSVERNIRTAVDAEWEQDSKCMQQTFDCDMLKKPSASEFVLLLTRYLQRDSVVRID